MPLSKKTKKPRNRCKFCGAARKLDHNGICADGCGTVRKESSIAELQESAQRQMDGIMFRHSVSQYVYNELFPTQQEEEKK